MIDAAVIMPTYNQAQWLPGALRSLEVPRLIVVDDGSTDATPAILAAHKLPNVITQPNAGTAAAINAGVDAAGKAGVLSWVSSDNVMARSWLPLLLRQIQKGAGAAYGGFYWNDGTRCAYHFTPYDPARLINDVNCFFGPAFLIRGDVWREAGPHRGRISHDYDHWLRVEEVCWRKGLRIAGVDEPLCWYNAHDKRVTVTRANEFDAHHWQAEARRRRGSQAGGA